MSAISVNPPFPLFTDADGQPLDDASIYIGAANQNPVSNPITVYWDSALTITAAQPIRTSGGYPVYNGTPARFYTNSDYSILVRDKNGAFIYTAASETDFISSEFVTFIQSGTGAVATTVQAKLRETVSVKDFGASASETAANNKTAIDAALAASASVELTPESFTTNAITIPASKSLFGKGFASVIVGRITAGANNLLNFLKISPASGYAIQITSGADEVSASNIEVTSAANEYAVVADLNGTNGFSIQNSSVIADGYAVLTNNQGLSTPAASTRIRVQDNYVKSVNADAIELNHPSAAVTGAIISGNFLEATGAGVSLTSGFAFGNAATRQWLFTGNVILDSRNEAIHIEDIQSGGVVACNSVKGDKNGLLTYPGGKAYPIVANSFEGPGSSGGAYSGVFIQYSSPTSPTNGVPIVGNVSSEYSIGFRLSPSLTSVPRVQLMESNSAINCTNGMYAEGGNKGMLRQVGSNFSSNCTTLFGLFGGPVSLGKMYSDTTPTNIMTNGAGGYSGFMPSSIDGFGFPLPGLITSAGSPTNIIIAPAGANQRFFGRLRFSARRSGVADWIYYTADIHWDGTTLTSTNILTRNGVVGAGAFGTPSFNVSGGNLRFSVTTTNATALNFLWAEFNGEYWDA